MIVINYPEELISEYINGKSTVQLSNEYGIHYSSIRKYLINNGVKLRSNKENSRRYSVNHNTFESIDNEEKAYWLGFLSADGYISSVNGKRVGLSLAERDREHLIKFNTFLESTYPICRYVSSGFGYGPYCRVIISSDKMYDDLCNLGVVEHKSKILEFQSSLPIELKKDYLRGYVDGDGCITHNGNSYALKIMGTSVFLDGVVDYLTQEGTYYHGRKEKRKKECDVLSLNMNGKTAYKTIELMYSHPFIYLDRKYDIAKEAIEYFSRLYQ